MDLRVAVRVVVLFLTARFTWRRCWTGIARRQNPEKSGHVDWPDSKGLNQWERTALELAEERSQLG
jgi:hypothetical protein